MVAGKATALAVLCLVGGCGGGSPTSGTDGECAAPTPVGSTAALPDSLDLEPLGTVTPVRWGNYIDVADAVPLLRQLLNSLLVVVVAVPVTIAIASWAAFVITTGARGTRRLLIGLSLVTLMVPASALWVPRVVLLENLALTDHTLVAAVPALMATTPFFVLLLALAYHRIPRSLFDAALVEGLTAWRTWRTVGLPLTRPATFAVAALAFVFHWSNLVEPLLLLADESTWVVSLGLRTLAAYEPTFYPLLLSGAVIATLPAVMFFALAHRAFFTRTLGS